MILEHGRTAIFFGLITALAPNGALAQCEQRVAMSTYAVCFPMGWKVQRNPKLDEVIACYGVKRCATAWGDAIRGVAFLFLTPAEKLPGGQVYHGPYDIVASRPHVGLPARTINKVEFPGDPQRKCFVGRRRLSWAGAWDELDGLEVNKRLFSVWSRYEDNGERTQAYRDAIREILQSISPN